VLLEKAAVILTPLPPLMKEQKSLTALQPPESAVACVTPVNVCTRHHPVSAQPLITLPWATGAKAASLG